MKVAPKPVRLLPPKPASPERTAASTATAPLALNRNDALVSTGAPAKKAATVWSPPTQGEWTLDAHGVRSDPVNVYFHGSIGQVTAALSQAGWTEAAVNSRSTNLRYLESIPGHEAIGLANKLLDTKLVDGIEKRLGFDPNWHFSDPFQKMIDAMPVSNQTLNGKPFEVAFEKNNDPLGGRDHLRVFDTGKKDADGQSVWAIAASRDTGIEVDLHRPEQAFLNHAVEKNTDLERDNLIASLKGNPHVATENRFSLDYGRTAAPATGAQPKDNQAWDVVLR